MTGFSILFIDSNRQIFITVRNILNAKHYGPDYAMFAKISQYGKSVMNYFHISARRYVPCDFQHEILLENSLVYIVIPAASRAVTERHVLVQNIIGFQRDFQ